MTLYEMFRPRLSRVGKLPPTKTHARGGVFAFSLLPVGHTAVLMIQLGKTDIYHMAIDERFDGVSRTDFLLARQTGEITDQNNGVYRVEVYDFDGDQNVRCSCTGDVTAGKIGRCKHALAVYALMDEANRKEGPE